MKFLLVLVAFAAVTLADVDNNKVHFAQQDGPAGVDQHFLVSYEARQQLMKLQGQMACGWPGLGIPPLAPYTQEELEFDLKTAIIQTINEVFHFRIDGLDDFDIKKFKLNVITNKVKFHFLFKKITVSGKYDTDTILDLLKQYGLEVRYEGKGDLDFNLENLSISGDLKYKIPILFGSLKITKLYVLVTLGECNSNISGLAGNGKWNRYLNDKIEDLIVSGINENTALISEKIESNLVPRVNALLKGKNFWTIYDLIFNSSPSDSSPSVCVPKADPWA